MDQYIFKHPKTLVSEESNSQAVGQLIASHQVLT